MFFKFQANFIETVAQRIYLVDRTRKPITKSHHRNCTALAVFAGILLLIGSGREAQAQARCREFIVPGPSRPALDFSRLDELFIQYQLFLNGKLSVRSERGFWKRLGPGDAYLIAIYLKQIGDGAVAIDSPDFARFPRALRFYTDFLLFKKLSPPAGLIRRLAIRAASRGDENAIQAILPPLLPETLLLGSIDGGESLVEYFAALRNLLLRDRQNMLVFAQIWRLWTFGKDDLRVIMRLALQTEKPNTASVGNLDVIFTTYICQKMLEARDFDSALINQGKKENAAKVNVALREALNAIDTFRALVADSRRSEFAAGLNLVALSEALQSLLYNRNAERDASSRAVLIRPMGAIGKAKLAAPRIYDQIVDYVAGGGSGVPQLEAGPDY